ncbi:uncharacterized protein LOC109820733 [Asparagus officinalis]|uniref:uncharacterized protein LOC109820733 n=1 Tax=Asparagus officinalis TaxID=4686 RepID=UPI00098E2650|nr:uncharacterized protein LOC109820733 [Asparagus officinalis]
MMIPGGNFDNKPNNPPGRENPRASSPVLNLCSPKSERALKSIAFKSFDSCCYLGFDVSSDANSSFSSADKSKKSEAASRASFMIVVLIPCEQIQQRQALFSGAPLVAAEIS